MSTVREIIEAKLKEYTGYFNAKQTDKIAPMYHPDAWEIPEGGKTAKGREAVKALFDELQSSGAMDKTELTRFEFEELSPDACMNSSVWTWFKPDGSKGGTIKDLVIWKKHNGDWLVYRSSYNSP